MLYELHTRYVIHLMEAGFT